MVKALIFLCLQAPSLYAIDVTNPAKDLTVVSGRTFTVEWDGSGENNRFEIDLYHCGSLCAEESCGEWVTALCPYEEEGCVDFHGDYDVVLPQPLIMESGPGYKIGVLGVGDESFGCSEEFSLIRSEDVPEGNDYSLNVTAPVFGDIAIIGEEYTVEFDYINGVGSRDDRFSVDLYEADGPGDCGGYVCPLCNKHLIGCRDTSGDLDVLFPVGLSPGDYRIRIGRFEDEGLFGCSEVFQVVEPWGLSFDFSFSF